VHKSDDTNKEAVKLCLILRANVRAIAGHFQPRYCDFIFHTAWKFSGPAERRSGFSDNPFFMSRRTNIFTKAWWILKEPYQMEGKRLSHFGLQRAVWVYELRPFFRVSFSSHNHKKLQK
jgi:hypothetical protein